MERERTALLEWSGCAAEGPPAHNPPFKREEATPPRKTKTNQINFFIAFFSAMKVDCFVWFVFLGLPRSCWLLGAAFLSFSPLPLIASLLIPSTIQQFSLIPFNQSTHKLLPFLHWSIIDGIGLFSSLCGAVRPAAALNPQIKESHPINHFSNSGKGGSPAKRKII